MSSKENVNSSEEIRAIVRDELENQTNEVADSIPFSRRDILKGVSILGVGAASAGLGTYGAVGRAAAQTSTGAGTIGTSDDPLEAIYVQDLYNTTDNISADSISTEEAVIGEGASDVFSGPVSRDLISTEPGSIEVWVDATNGSDSNDGSQSNPFATFDRAMEAVPLISRHNVIINVEPGSYGGLDVPPTLIQYNSGNQRQLVIEGTGSRTDATVDWIRAQHVFGGTGLSIRNLTVTGAEPERGRSAILLRDVNEGIIRGVNIDSTDAEWGIEARDNSQVRLTDPFDTGDDVAVDLGDGLNVGVRSAGDSSIRLDSGSLLDGTGVDTAFRYDHATVRFMDSDVVVPFNSLLDERAGWRSDQGTNTIQPGRIGIPAEDPVDETGNRSLGTWYQNSSLQPIAVNIVNECTVDGGTLDLTIWVSEGQSSTSDNIVSSDRVTANTGDRKSTTTIVPPGSFVQANNFGDVSLHTWTEQRLGDQS